MNRQTTRHPMAVKSKNSRSTGTTAQYKPVREMADTARKNYEQAVRTSQRFQDEAAQWGTRVMSETGRAADWQRQYARLTALTNNVMPFAQKRLDETMNLMEKNSRDAAELMRKAIDALQTQNLPESQTKWMEGWASSMKAMQSNVEALTAMSTRALDSWVDLVRKNTEVTEVRVPK